MAGLLTLVRALGDVNQVIGKCEATQYFYIRMLTYGHMRFLMLRRDVYE